jgi:hypothetical protein
MTQLLALIEAFDRHGTLLARAPVTRWPFTVGRSLDCDLVLDDPHIAPVHLRADRPMEAPRLVSIQVGQTVNGATLRGKRYGSGKWFDWPGGVPLEIGRTRLALRLADAPVAAEQALPPSSRHNVAATVLLVALTVAAALGSSWLEANDVSKYLQSLPGLLLTLVVVLGAWCGLWAIANKVFDHRLQFWHHVRIACTMVLAVEAVDGVASLAAFAFSWEALSRFDYLLTSLVLAAGIYAHLAAVLPRRRAGLAWAVGAVVLLAVPAWLGTQWLDRMRLSNELYMSGLFPPSLRVAPAVPIPQFLQETQALRGRLDRRLLSDGHADDDK